MVTRRVHAEERDIRFMTEPRERCQYSEETVVRAWFDGILLKLSAGEVFTARAVRKRPVRRVNGPLSGCGSEA